MMLTGCWTVVKTTAEISIHDCWTIAENCWMIVQLLLDNC